MPTKQADRSPKFQFSWRAGNRFELLIDGSQFFPHMLAAIEAAQRQVLLEMYLVESGTVTTRFIEALASAARRGVDVRLLLPGPVTDHPAARHAGRYLYRRLLESGVRIFEYQPRFLHQKAVLCDDWVSLGSANLDRWNLHWNLEANQEVADAGFARATQEMFERDFRDAVEIRLDAWERRPWYARVLEYAWSVVAMWAERLGRRKDVY